MAKKSPSGGFGITPSSRDFAHGELLKLVKEAIEETGYEQFSAGEIENEIRKLHKNSGITAAKISPVLQKLEEQKWLEKVGRGIYRKR